jgi:hypothetical protein
MWYTWWVKNQKKGFDHLTPHLRIHGTLVTEKIGPENLEFTSGLFSVDRIFVKSVRQRWNRSLVTASLNIMYQTQQRLDCWERQDEYTLVLELWHTSLCSLNAIE